MNIYIRSTASISPQKTFFHQPSPAGAAIPWPLAATDDPLPKTELSPLSFLTAPVEYTGNRLTCIEPDYRGLLDGKMIRRMSRIIKMGVAAATACLGQAGQDKPDAIVTGTAYGCLDDTGIFLKSLVERQEESLSPGAFIQSTHNTVGAQIALMLQCTGYNNTFVHRGFSFESALLDAVVLLQEGEAANVLVGSADEITDDSHAILSRFGLYRRQPVSNLSLFAPLARGAIAGEGAAFFLLTQQSSPGDYAKLEGLTTFYKPDGIMEIEQHILSFLETQQVGLQDLDLVITGNNGDRSGDAIYQQLGQSIFMDNRRLPYKHLCGEYPTSTSFACWLAANMIRTDRKIKKILIYNHYLTIHHSLLLLSA